MHKVNVLNVNSLLGPSEFPQTGFVRTYFLFVFLQQNRSIFRYKIQRFCKNIHLIRNKFNPDSETNVVCKWPKSETRVKKLTVYNFLDNRKSTRAWPCLYLKICLIPVLTCCILKQLPFVQRWLDLNCITKYYHDLISTF